MKEELNAGLGQPMNIEDQLKNARNEIASGTEVEATQEMPVVTSENGISKGEERYNKIGESISKAKDKVSNFFKSGFSKFGRLIKTGTIGVLNTPETAQKGLQYAGEKMEQGFDFMAAKQDQFENWSVEKGNQAYEFGKEKVQQTKEFIGDKANQIAQFAQDKALSVEALASLVKEKTVEKYEGAKNSVVARFDKTVEFGKNSIDSAKFLASQAKESFLNKKNSFFIKLLERKAEIQSSKLEKTMAKLGQYKTVDDLQMQFV